MKGDNQIAAVLLELYIHLSGILTHPKTLLVSKTLCCELSSLLKKQKNKKQ